MALKLPAFIKLPDPSAMSRRERLMVVGSVLVVLAVVIDRGVMGPWWDHTRKVAREIRGLERTIQAHERLLSRRPQIEGKAKVYHDYLNVENPGVVEMGGLIREVEKLGQESGISLGEVKPQPGESGDVYERLVIDVAYQGSIEQWMQFVYFLQTSKSLFTIERADLQRLDKSPNQLQGTVRVSSLARRQSALEAQIDAAVAAP